jgi:hypothetical protein
VAIAIAGFSGIVVALQRSDVPWSELDKKRFSMILELSLASVFWSFIPRQLASRKPATIATGWRW